MSNRPPNKSKPRAALVCPIPDLFRTQYKIMALLYGISGPAISKWKARGMPTNSDGTLNGPDVVQWRREQDTLTITSGESSENLERVRAATAGIKELELAQKRGELAEVAEVDEEVSRMVISFRMSLQALPAAVAPRLEGLEAREIMALLTGEVDRILRDLKGDE